MPLGNQSPVTEIGFWKVPTLADPDTALRVEEENLVGARRVEISGRDFRFQHGERTEEESQHRS